MGCATVTSGGGGGAKALDLDLQPPSAPAEAETPDSITPVRRTLRNTFPWLWVMQKFSGTIIRHLLLIGEIAAVMVVSHLLHLARRSTPRFLYNRSTMATGEF